MQYCTQSFSFVFSWLPGWNISTFIEFNPWIFYSDSNRRGVSRRPSTIGWSLSLDRRSDSLWDGLEQRGGSLAIRYSACIKYQISGRWLTKLQIRPVSRKKSNILHNLYISASLWGQSSILRLVLPVISEQGFPLCQAGSRNGISQNSR